jgi:polar amino acid transport system substrate-binding protein
MKFFRDRLKTWSGFSFAVLLTAVVTMMISCGGGGDGDPANQGADEPAPLRVGMELAYPPFEMMDASGQPSGVSVDLAAALAGSLGRPLKVENMEFTGLIEALRTGKIDCIISSLTATEERRRVIDFSDGYVSTGLCLLLAAGHPDLSDITELDSEKFTVVVKQGTTGHLYAMNNLSKATLRVLEKEDACVLEVTQGKADAFIYDQMSVYRHWNRHQDSTHAMLRPFQKETWAVGIPKGSDELRLSINSFLKEFRESGGFQKLADKYLAEEKAAFARLGYPFIFDAE